MTTDRHQDDRRSRSLTPADVADIAAAVVALQQCECPVDKEELSEAVKFFKNMNDFLDGSKRTIWNCLLVIFVGGVIGLIGIGVWHKSGN